MFNRRIVLAITLVFMLIGCAKTKSSQDIQKDWKEYKTEQFSIKYPHTWDVNETGFENTAFIIVSKQTSIRDFFQENVRLVEHNLDDSITSFNALIESDVDYLQREASNLKIIQNEMISENGKSYQLLKFEAATKYGTILTEKRYFSSNSKVYILTFACKVREMKRYQPIGEAMMQSFSF